MGQIGGETDDLKLVAGPDKRTVEGSDGGSFTAEAQRDLGCDLIGHPDTVEIDV